MALPWSKFPIKVASNRALSPAARLVYSAVVYHATGNPGRPVGAPKLAELAGVSRSTAQLALKDLERVGLLTGHRQGSGKATFWEIPTVEVCGCPETYRRTCPNSGRCLPATGQVACRLAASYLAAVGQVNGGDHKRERDSEREDNALSPDTIQLGEEIRSRTGLHLSRKQLAFLEPAFRSGVPLGLALELAGTWAVTESPWGFAGRLQAAWGEVVNDARALGVSRQNGVPHGLPAERVERVRRHGKPEHVQWAFGEGERG